MGKNDIVLIGLAGLALLAFSRNRSASVTTPNVDSAAAPIPAYGGNPVITVETAPTAAEPLTGRVFVTETSAASVTDIQAQAADLSTRFYTIRYTYYRIGIGAASNGTLDSDTFRGLSWSDPDGTYTFKAIHAYDAKPIPK